MTLLFMNCYVRRPLGLVQDFLPYAFTFWDGEPAADQSRSEDPQGSEATARSVVNGRGVKILDGLSMRGQHLESCSTSFLGLRLTPCLLMKRLFDLEPNGVDVSYGEVGKAFASKARSVAQERRGVKTIETSEIGAWLGIADEAAWNPNRALAGTLAGEIHVSGRIGSQEKASMVCKRNLAVRRNPSQTLPIPARGDFEASKIFAMQGRKANMPLALQVVTSHLLGALDIEAALSNEPTLAKRLLQHAGGETDALKSPRFPRLFLLDGCSLTPPLGPLSRRLRANSPGSKFFALLPPKRNGIAEMIRLFHWGIDGMLVLDKKWKKELPEAVLAVLSNRVWAPTEVLLAFVSQMKVLLSRQLLPGQSLTMREGQVLQLLFRRLTNKEIACELMVSERTAKFHVCNVLNKLGFGNRKTFLETFERLEPLDLVVLQDQRGF